MLNSFETLGGAYIAGLRELVEYGAVAPAVLDPLSPASRFGQRPRGSIELLGQAFRVDIGNPSIIVSGLRPPDLRYLFGQTIWFLAGSNDLAFLNYYNPRAQNFSHDGSSLCGAFGHRIFGINSAQNQARHVVNLLRRDPGSRRAYISVIDVDDLLNPTKETPCNCGIQFFVRKERLHTVCSMRAQHALFLLPNDAFLFLTLQAVIASELNLECGSYTHCSNTFHVYEDEFPLVETMVTSKVSEIAMPGWQGGFATVDKLVRYEKEMRAAVLAEDNRRVDDIFEDSLPHANDMLSVLRDAMYVIALRKLSRAGYENGSAARSLRQIGIVEGFL